MYLLNYALTKLLILSVRQKYGHVIDNRKRRNELNTRFWKIRIGMFLYGFMEGVKIKRRDNKMKHKVAPDWSEKQLNEDSALGIAIRLANRASACQDRQNRGGD